MRKGTLNILGLGQAVGDGALHRAPGPLHAQTWSIAVEVHRTSVFPSSE
jgi:hypothetical protein